jgi:hypothetical protein
VEDFELEAKYQPQRSVIGQIDPDELQDRFGQINGVGDDFSAPNYRCADAGSLQYFAYHFDSETDRYRPMKLREEGDAPTQNRGGTAPSLSEWLRSVVLALDVEGVRPFESACLP